MKMLGLIAGAAAVLVYTLGFAVGVATSNGNILTALVITPLLIAATYPIATRLARDHDDQLRTIVMAALVAKLLGSLLRYYVAYVVYGGAADANQYDRSGADLAPLFRQGDFSADVGRIVGTGFIKVLTGSVYAVGGVSRLGGFLVFSWMSFVGLLLFWRAFRIGVPNGDERRYALLVLFLPSLIYWPSSIGKEAWMVLGLGLCAYGAAALFARRPGAMALIPGLVATTMVRPHLSLLVVAALTFAVIVERIRVHSPLAPALRLFLLVVVLGAAVFFVGRTESFLGVESLTRETVDQELGATEEQTGRGGSEFTPVRVNTPLDLPLATVTVLFRPFPFEANNLQALLAAGEGLILLGLCVVSWRRLRNVPRYLRSSPYVAYSLAFVLAFVYAFSSFGNFGILARQRVQMLPLLLVLLALPPVQRRRAARTPSPPAEHVADRAIRRIGY